MDRTNPAHELIIRDETVTFQDTPGTWHKLTTRAPDRDEIHRLLTNEMTLPPGVLSECYRRRWRIEKAFDQQEQKLDERQAWGKSNTVKTIPAIAVCLAHNLRQLFHATLKTDAAIADTKVITAYQKDLDRRAAKSQAAGRAFPRALYLALYRPTELSLPFLRLPVPHGRQVGLRYHLHARDLLRASPGPPTPPYGAISVGFLWTGFPSVVELLFQDRQTTVYVVINHRARLTVTATLGENFPGVLVSDCLAIYDDVNPHQQKCYSHHFRALDRASSVTRSRPVRGWTPCACSCAPR